MSITVQEPGDALRDLCPHSVGDCLEYLIEADDYIQFLGTRPSFSFQINGTGSTNGEMFTILGKQYVVDQSADYTAKGCNLVSGTSEEFAERIVQMLRSDPTLDNAYRIEVTVAATYGVNIVGYEAGENQVFLDNDLSNLNGITNISENAGSNPQYIQGMRIWWQVWEFSVGIDAPLSPISHLNGPPPLLGLNKGTGARNLAPLPVSITEDVKKRLRSTVPECDTDAFLDSQAMVETYVRIGTLQDNSCDSEFLETIQTTTIRIYNYVNQCDDPGANERYCQYSGIPDPGIKLADHIFSRPSCLTYCLDQCGWMAAALYREGFTTESNWYQVLYNFHPIGGGGPSAGTSVMVRSNGFFVFPVGPKNILETAEFSGGAPDLTTIEYITVRVTFWDGSLNIVTNESTIRLSQNCCDKVEVNFLSDAGIYETIGFEEVSDYGGFTEGTAICRDVCCGACTDSDAGRRVITTGAYETITIETRTLLKSDELRSFYRQFLRSEHKRIKRTDAEGNEVFEDFYIDPGKTRIWQIGRKLRLSVEGVFSIEEKYVTY